MITIELSKHRTDCCEKPWHHFMQDHNLTTIARKHFHEHSQSIHVYLIANVFVGPWGQRADDVVVVSAAEVLVLHRQAAVDAVIPNLRQGIVEHPAAAPAESPGGDH